MGKILHLKFDNKKSSFFLDLNKEFLKILCYIFETVIVAKELSANITEHAKMYHNIEKFLNMFSYLLVGDDEIVICRLEQYSWLYPHLFL